ncbi:MAG: Transcriptional regulator, GntR family [Herbaspirillum sp.]|jgi:DNA-binding GntR family transcriptional regulator|nr:Transcriptional regulator, GntR family [Herbaspirillum sp.]
MFEEAGETPPKQSGTPLLRESVYAQLRAEILSCELPPGAEIREAELAARFLISKSPVRDALMRLEREGLVNSTPRQGYRVAPISLTDVRDMFHLRGSLECACMERIVQDASDAQLQTLEPFRRFAAGEWEGGFVAYNRAFHLTLAELAGNARIYALLGELIDQMERVVRVSVRNAKKGNTDGLVEEHCQIIDALRDRQFKRAERLGAKHIAAAAKRVSEAIERLIVVP